MKDIEKKGHCEHCVIKDIVLAGTSCHWECCVISGDYIIGNMV